MGKEVKSITITYLSKVSFASLNGSDSDADNINTIKKITLENNEELPYVSSQAIRRALRDQLCTLGENLSKITNSSNTKHPAKTACNPEEYIDDDLFGFMDADEETIKRTSPIRVESLIALSKYQGDLDFGTNLMGTASGGNPNIFETEIHSGIYRGTILIELDRIGNGEHFKKELAKDERKKRVQAFLDAFQNLWSSGRQSRFLADISPKFIAAALMYSKNPVFLEAVEIPISIKKLKNVENDYSDFIKSTCFAAQKEVFSQIEGECQSLKDGFVQIKKWVDEYYGK
ncbi:MAG: type I-B CRISPR-associated protein Cas7/Cst2/DevR [Candidatus Omnitrophica bacterium]|nr:type I-B CRISPR-associated protein Cas7/Cst2/DevR [Candidatus Omnitrophota bacterium]